MKMRLSGLVVLTTMVGYAMAPGALQGSTLLWTTLGTALCVNAANTWNQWAEVRSPHPSLR
jgi:protoheme IX farnesyltransferase